MVKEILTRLRTLAQGLDAAEHDTVRDEDP